MSYAAPTLVIALLKTTVVSPERGPKYPPFSRIAVKHVLPAETKHPHSVVVLTGLNKVSEKAEKLLYSLIFAGGSVTMEAVCSSLCGPGVDPRLALPAFKSWNVGGVGSRFDVNMCCTIFSRRHTSRFPRNHTLIKVTFKLIL